MPEHELELAVGETLRIGDCFLTVIDVDGDDVSFRIDPARPQSASESGELAAAPPAK